ncbi:glycoside hydrolase family 2 protein [Ceraceosorus bombacis]|uniref:Glycoside hydrolase family 2 protein n=1 Tax=Ceraceosorus bombacis TaxID=401625 RepID=A0A0P1BFU7_9BASI|nr:glycoside hydrolase family 2 protein [Ceraceosorus bombacis]
MSDTASIPRPEYPRPDRVRPDYPHKVLNGTWAFAFDEEDRGIDERWNRGGAQGAVHPALDKQIIVPFAHQTPASGLNDERACGVVWYARQFSMLQLLVQEAIRDEERVLLHFGAVDYETKVWVEGELVVEHRGGHVPFHADITDVLQAARDANKTHASVTVRARDAPHDLTQPRGKQYWRAQPESIFYHPTTGIWQSVWVERVPRARIEHFTLVPDIDTGTLSVRAETLGLHKGLEGQLEVEVSLLGTTISASTVTVGSSTSEALAVISVRIPASSPPEKARTNLSGPLTFPPEVHRLAWTNGLALWSPETPTLYDVTLRLRTKTDSVVLDTVRTYAGMRKGYWPDSGLTPPTAEALKVDIEKMKSIGMNGARKHQKVEDPYYHYWADQLGYLVWGEAANAYDYSSTYSLRFIEEFTASIRRDINHPSVVVWTPINESWGVPELQTSETHRSHIAALYHHIKSIDPSRLISDNDGWEHVTTDLFTFHDYAEYAALKKTCASLDTVLGPKAGRPGFVGSENKYSGQPLILSEFGGVAINLSKSNENAWGYNEATSEEDLLARLEGLVSAVVDSPLHIDGYVYTQTADIETEVNGLLTPRREWKVDAAKLKAIFSRRPDPAKVAC